MKNPSCRFDLQMFANWFADFADFCYFMRAVSTMVLDLQMFDSEDVVSVVDLDVDTTERSSRSSGERCEPVGKGKKAEKRQEERQRQESRHGGDSSW